MACQVKTLGNSGKQDVPCVLWIGVRDGDPGPIMLAREKPEAFKLKVIKSYTIKVILSVGYNAPFRYKSSTTHAAYNCYFTIDTVPCVDVSS